MKFAKATLGSALLAATLATGVVTTTTPSLAQTNTNSGTKTPDMTDVDKKNRQMVPQARPSGAMGGTTNTNSGTKTPDQQDVDKRVRSNVPAAAPTGAARTSGSGATNTNSGTKTPDEDDVNKKVTPGNATTPAPRR